MSEAAASGARSRGSPRTPTSASVEAERLRARAMLLRLAGAEEEAEAFVRRRVPLDELELDRDADAARALAVLTEARLLTVDEGTVEVAHEALLREWPRLRGWLEEDAEGRRLHQHLIGAAGEWRDSERDPAELYRGARLASALDWAADARPRAQRARARLPRREQGGERARGRAPAARRSAACGPCSPGSACCSPPPIVAGVIALSERGSARSAATAEAAQRLGAQALSEERLDQALRLATAGVALDDSVATRSSLLSTLLRSPAAIRVLTPTGEELPALALSPDGETLAASDARRYRDPVRHRYLRGSRRASGARNGL